MSVWFLWCQNRSVQLLYRMYACPTSAHWDFRYGYRHHDVDTFTLKTTLPGRQNVIWGLMLKKIKQIYQRSPLLCYLFLLKVRVINDYLYALQRQSSPNLLTMLNRARRFLFILIWIWRNQPMLYSANRTPSLQFILGSFSRFLLQVEHNASLIQYVLQRWHYTQIA